MRVGLQACLVAALERLRLSTESIQLLSHLLFTKRIAAIFEGTAAMEKMFGCQRMACCH